MSTDKRATLSMQKPEASVSALHCLEVEIVFVSCKTRGGEKIDSFLAPKPPIRLSGSLRAKTQPFSSSLTSSPASVARAPYGENNTAGFSTKPSGCA